MKITADTNVLVRALTEDDHRQTQIPQAELAQANGVALALPALLRTRMGAVQGLQLPASDIAEAIRRLIDSANVMVNRPAVEAGLAILRNGGDFADGVIAYEGTWLGADSFVSFDRQAVSRLGEATRLLS